LLIHNEFWPASRKPTVRAMLASVIVTVASALLVPEVSSNAVATQQQVPTHWATVLCMIDSYPTNR
jgi:hypothetical protein